MWTLILKPRNLSCPADFPYFTSHYACEEDGAVQHHAEELLGVGGRQRGEADTVAREVGLAIDLGRNEDQHGIDQEGNGGYSCPQIHVEVEDQGCDPA